MKMKKETGITLVSLVVTIIILIILAGISINTLVGENGIITKAQQAKENTLLAQEEEAKQLNQLYSQLNYIGGTTEDIESETMDKLLNFKKIIAETITMEGINTQQTDSVEVMADNIKKIKTQYVYPKISGSSNNSVNAIFSISEIRNKTIHINSFSSNTCTLVKAVNSGNGDTWVSLMKFTGEKSIDVEQLIQDNNIDVVAYPYFVFYVNNYGGITEVYAK